MFQICSAIQNPIAEETSVDRARKDWKRARSKPSRKNNKLYTPDLDPELIDGISWAPTFAT